MSIQSFHVSKDVKSTVRVVILYVPGPGPRRSKSRATTTTITTTTATTTRTSEPHGGGGGGGALDGGGGGGGGGFTKRRGRRRRRRRRRRTRGRRLGVRWLVMWLLFEERRSRGSHRGRRLFHGQLRRGFSLLLRSPLLLTALQLRVLCDIFIFRPHGGRRGRGMMLIIADSG